MKAKHIFTALALVTLAAAPASAKKMSDLKIYINPGHGGYTANDRNIPVYPFAQGDTMGFWESKANLYKGLHMYHILDSLGANPMISRVKNRGDIDNRNLYEIAYEANDFGADLFFSIHSNAGEAVNYLLMLYREETRKVPRYPENVTISQLLANNLQTNEMSNWTREPWIQGDIDFYWNIWGGSGLGVLRKLYVPGLLSEGGMHEHRPQAYRLLNDDYWWLEAWHFVHAIMDFYDMAPEDRFVTGNVAGVVYDDHNLRESAIPGIDHFTMHGRDKLLPVNGCLIELLDKSENVVQKRTTDQLFNGVFVLRNVQPGDYTLRFSKDEYYTLERPVTVEADKVTYANTAFNMKREFPLEVVSFTPLPSEEDGLVSCSAPIEIEFNTDVDEESFEKAFTLTPQVKGRWVFSENYHKAKYVYDVSLEPDVTYTVRIDASAKTPDLTYPHPQMNEAVEYSFTTRNRSRLALTETYPADGGEAHFASPTVELRFDNKIKSTGMADLFKVTDSKGNSIPLNARASSYNTVGNGFGNAVIALQSDLTVGETYTVTLSGDLRDAESLPMGTDVQFTFKAVDATESVPADAEVIDGMEDTAVLSGDLDASAGMSTKPSVAKSTTPRLFGEAAVKLSYNFAETHDGLAMWNYTPAGDPLQVELGDNIGIFVNGDFSNHELWISATSGTDTKWIKLCDLTFRGWEYCSAVFDNLEAGTVYNLDHLRIVQVESPVTQKGSIVLDNMTRIKNGSDGIVDIIDNANDGITVDATRDLVTVTTDSKIKALQIINGAGMTMARSTASSQLNISGLNTGIYLLRIITDRGLITRRMAIR